MCMAVAVCSLNGQNANVIRAVQGVCALACFTYVMVAGWEVLSWACQQAMFNQQQTHTFHAYLMSSKS